MDGFLSDVRGLAELERHDQVMILRRTFAEVGWETPRILDGLDEVPHGQIQGLAGHADGHGVGDHTGGETIGHPAATAVEFVGPWSP